MRYYTTLLEDWVEHFYNKLDIFFPHQIDLHTIAYRLGYCVTYKDISSRFYENEVIIDKRLSPQEQWQDFAHELCHAERHAGNQLVMPNSFLELQEFQAKLFAYHFCIPTFMLLRLNIPESKKEAIYNIANTFFVTLEFAEQRLNLYWNRVSNSSLVAENYYKEMI